ncbi:MAG: hypothetical protein IJS19_01540 [Muribaculaceae bacterium]|nr:hypothetical protein [Muribaculaceae bacterium]MBQ7211346.1 hypothetical protein [Muribaculaceae bacterium]
MNRKVKKIMLLAAALIATLPAMNAQLLTVESIKKVPVPSGTLVDNATISPDGSFVVFSELSQKGLKKLDLANSKTSVISTKADGFGVKISGNDVIYREMTTDANHLRWATVKTKNLKTQREQTLVDKSRDVHALSLRGGKALVVEGKQLKSKSLAASSTATDVAVSIIDGQLCVIQNGATRIISPQGTRNASYLWPELSPDGRHICYYHSDTGTYVCDLNGKNVKPLGQLHAAKWLDNSTVVAMRDRDNGYVITSSEIVAKNISNLREQVLTPKGVVATYPTASAKRISFVTPKGELYLINLK